jgi:hypothetical protein
MPRAFLALILMLLPSLTWLHLGGTSKALADDSPHQCVDKLIGQKLEFERTNPGIIIEPSFGACFVEPYFRYVQGYEGGECFFLRIVSASERSVLIQGIGSQLEPFETFDAAFKRDNGIEAQINLALVTSSQCPAVTFLRSLQRDRLEGRPEFLEIEQAPLRSGEPLRGRADKWIGGFLELLLVDESGRVHNFTSQSNSRPSISFALRWQTSPSPAPQPQLLLAINSTTRLDAFKFDRDGAAETFLDARSRRRATMA